MMVVARSRQTGGGTQQGPSTACYAGRPDTAAEEAVAKAAAELLGDEWDSDTINAQGGQKGKKKKKKRNPKRHQEVHGGTEEERLPDSAQQLLDGSKEVKTAAASSSAKMKLVVQKLGEFDDVRSSPGTPLMALSRLT
jgi:hypothetical protein